MNDHWLPLSLPLSLIPLLRENKTERTDCNSLMKLTSLCARSSCLFCFWPTFLNSLERLRPKVLCADESFYKEKGDEGAVTQVRRSVTKVMHSVRKSGKAW